jgi:hypothetical protein
MENINLYFSIAICVFGALTLILTAYLDSIANSIDPRDVLKEASSFQTSIKGLISVGIILLVGGGSYLYTHFIAKCSCSSNQFDFKVYLGVLGVFGLVLAILSYRLNSEVDANSATGSEGDTGGPARRSEVSASLAHVRYIMLFASGVLLIASVGFLVKKIVDENNEKGGESSEKVIDSGKQIV